MPTGPSENGPDRTGEHRRGRRETPDARASRRWHVVDVEDPAGGGQDFAYTVGLAGAVTHELYLWARPTHGLDPGEDWRFSHRDLAGLLDDFARLALSGDLPQGRVLVEPMDAGLSVVTFTVGAPRPAAELGADLLPPAQLMTPLGWSLRRPQPRPPRPVDAAALPHLRERLADTVEATRALRSEMRTRGIRPPTVPAAWSPGPPQELDVSPARPLGPLSDLVVARAEQVLSSDAALLSRYVRFLGLAAAAGAGPEEALARLAAHARAAGRGQVTSELDRQCTRVVNALTGVRAPTRRWREARHGWLSRYCRAHQLRVAPSLRGLVLQGVLALLSAEALLDVVEDDLLLLSTGPWSWAVSGGHPPGPEWQAPSWAVATVSDLLSPLGGAALADAGRRLRQAEQDDTWRLAQDLLLGLMTTSAAAPPPAPMVSASQLAGLGPGDVEGAMTVEVVLVPAVACAARLGPQTWRQLTEPLRPAVPGLPLTPPESRPAR